MLKRCIIAENRKLHASPIWVIFFVLPLISAANGCSAWRQAALLPLFLCATAKSLRTRISEV